MEDGSGLSCGSSKARQQVVWGAEVAIRAAAWWGLLSSYGKETGRELQAGILPFVPLSSLRDTP